MNVLEAFSRVCMHHLSEDIRSKKQNYYRAAPKEEQMTAFYQVVSHRSGKHYTDDPVPETAVDIAIFQAVKHVPAGIFSYGFEES